MTEEKSLDLKSMAYIALGAVALINAVCCGMCRDDESDNHTESVNVEAAHQAGAEETKEESKARKKVDGFVKLLGKGNTWGSNELSRLDDAMASCKALGEAARAGCEEKIANAIAGQLEVLVEKKGACLESDSMKALLAFHGLLDDESTANRLPSSEQLAESITGGIAGCYLLAASEAVAKGDFMRADKALQDGRPFIDESPALKPKLEPLQATFAERKKEFIEKLASESKRLGQSVKSDRREVTTWVQSVKISKQFKNSRQEGMLSKKVLEPSDGNVFLTITMKQRNDSNEMMIGAKDSGIENRFKLVDAFGQQFEENIELAGYVLRRQILKDYDVRTGKSFSFKLFYEIPKDLDVGDLYLEVPGGKVKLSKR